ncbi:MAG: TonB-dependent receptor [Hyphomonadaceae bacterium]
MIVSTRLGRRLVLGAAAAALVAQPALAQPPSDPPASQAPADGDSPRDVVVITGIGPARTGDEMIASTTVLAQDDVISRLSGGLGDTLNGLPGVSSTAFGPGASRPIIRGLGAERVQVLTNGIGVIDASSASPDHAVTGDPLGAERIEILRGPATLAYGGGATGGVVNVIDGLIVEELPEKTFSAAGYLGYNSADEGKTAAARVTGSSGPLVGVLSWNGRESSDLEIPGFAESARQRALEEEEEGGAEDEHEEAYGVLPNSGVESQSLSGGLSLVGDDGFIGVAVRRLENKYGIVGAHEHEEEAATPVSISGVSPLAIGVAAVGDTPEMPFIDMEQTRVDVRGGWNFLNGPFERVTGAVSVVDYKHTEFEGPGEPGTVFTNEGYEARLEAQHAEFMGLKGSIGWQASSRDFRAVGDEAFVTPTVTDQAGVFAFETYEQGDWGLEGGLRFDRVRVDNSIAGSRSFDTLNASFGVHGHVTENLFLGVSLNSTERAPTDVELFAEGPHLATQQFEVGDATLDTEKGVSLEASARWEAGPLEIGASVYRFAFQDFVYLAATGATEDDLPVFQFSQDDADFTGAELTASYLIGDGLGASWKVDGAVDAVRGELDGGGDLPRIPPASAMLGVEADTGFVKARLETRWADDQNRVAAFELPTDGWTVVDLTTTWSVADGVDLIVAGTNLTDEEVRYHASPLKDFAPMAGRSFRVGVRAEF